MDNASTKKPVLAILSIIHEVFYFLLLPWPAYVLIAYMLFAGDVKLAFIFGVFILEAVQGVFILLRSWRRLKSAWSLGSKIHFGVLGVSYGAYVVTVVIYLISVFGSFL